MTVIRPIGIPLMRRWRKLPGHAPDYPSDANPRLVEPMNAVFAGVNLADLQVQVSTGEPIPTMEPDAKEIRTHMLMMGLLTAASARGRRLDVVVELMRALAGRGLYAGILEELLPVQIDFKSVVPSSYLLGLLLNPRSATALSVSSISSYSLSPSAARQIADLSVGRRPP